MIIIIVITSNSSNNGSSSSSNNNNNSNNNNDKICSAPLRRAARLPFRARARKIYWYKTIKKQINK